MEKMPAPWIRHFHQLCTRGLLPRPCNFQLYLNRAPFFWPWETWIQSPALLYMLRFVPSLRWNFANIPLQYEGERVSLAASAHMDEHFQHVMRPTGHLSFDGCGGHVFKSFQAEIVGQRVHRRMLLVPAGSGVGSIRELVPGYCRGCTTNGVASLEVLRMCQAGECCRGLHVAAGSSSIRAARGHLIATKQLGRGGEEGGLRRMQIRGKEKLKREVQVLTKILKSKASWGAKTAKLLKSSNVEVKPLHVCEVLRIHHSRIDQVFKFFKWAKQQKRCKRGKFMFTKMIKLLGDAEKFSEIWCLLDDMKKERRLIDPFLLLGVIRSYVRVGKMDEAIAAFGAMEKYGCRPNTLVFNCMIAILRKAGQVTKAEALFRNMDRSSCAPDAFTYSMLIDLKGKSGQVDAAFDLFQEMHKRGCKPNVFTYSSLISSLGKAGRFPEACNLLRGMKINGCDPNNVTYNGLIGSLAQAGQADLAYLYYTEMLSLGFVPDVFTYAIMIACLIKVENEAGAHALFQTATMKSRFTDFDVLKSVLGNLCKSGHYEAGVKFFEDVKSSGYDPSAGTYNVLIHSLPRAGKVGEALDLFQEMVRKGACPDLVALNALSNGLVKERNLSAAINVFQFMTKQGISADIYTYGTLVNVLCKADQFDDAYQVVTQEMLEKGCPPNAHMYNILIDNLGKAGRVEEAFKVFERMSEQGCFPDTVTYNTVMNVVGRVGKVDLAHHLFQQMKEKGCEPTIFTYNIIIGNLVRAGRAEVATRVIKEMIANHIVPNQVTLNCLLQAQEETFGGYSDLVNLCKDILSAHSSASTIAPTAQCGDLT